MREYRIYRDDWLSTTYKAQVKTTWWPFWRDISDHKATKQSALEAARLHAMTGYVEEIQYLGRWLKGKWEISDA